ncbi:hypothetical protein ACIQXM_01960 [Arthrobacter sp. NPDC097144]|uniref:hypothetical protein n=1 Tax=Arthrobacter sp. NPDC097144 TaxID=3363946 RepID=UPI00381E5B87
MTERLIHPEDYRLPHPPLIAFLRANGLNERDVAAAFPLIMEGSQLTVTAFVFEVLPNGERRKVPIPGAKKFVKRTVTVPLKSPPEDHGL